MSAATVDHDGKRTSFVSDMPLSMRDLCIEVKKYFNNNLLLAHDGIVVDESLQVADYGSKPVFLLVNN
jgi:hypothetical protein